MILRNVLTLPIIPLDLQDDELKDTDNQESAFNIIRGDAKKKLSVKSWERGARGGGGGGGYVFLGGEKRGGGGGGGGGCG